jgi:hypothetical protein
MTTTDPTETIRRAEQARINAEAAERATLEAKHGQVWSTEEMTRDFTVSGFGAPLIVVTRKADGQRGSLYFQHRPRFYWGFQEG